MVFWKGFLRVAPLLLVAFGSASTRVTDLRCEYLHEPLGVDADHPRLSWITVSSDRGQIQLAYQVLVATDPAKLAQGKADLWDSGKVPSGQSNQVAYQGKPLQAREQCYWKARVWTSKGVATGWSSPSRWSVGLLNASNWHAQWIGLPDLNRPEDQFAVPGNLRKTFHVAAPGILRATLYVTALGLYEVRLNGQRVGDHLLAPEWTNYFKRVQYQTFDVTKLVHSGANTIGSLIANGWYSGGWQMWRSKLTRIYGKDPSFFAQLEILGSDGSHQTISTDQSWKGTLSGPLRFAGIYEGETIDARKSMPGWDTPTFNDHGWQSVTVTRPKVGKIEWQRNEPIRMDRTLTAISVKEPKPGVYVFDLGQNIAGWSRLRLHEAARTQVTLQFNEVLNPDGTVYMDNLHAGHLSSGDRQIDRYTCRGDGVEQFEPHFTYHGFRYVQVTGLTHRPTANSLVGCVFHSGFTQTGTFECSDPLLNRLAANIQWSQRGNMMGVPTDCCQRDERCGYTGDAQFFMPTAIYNFDVAAFYNKWLTDVCEDSQNADGSFADHAPTFGPGDHWNVGWSDAGIICPYTIWKTYGDTKVIREHYASMQRNMELLKRSSPTYVHTLGIGNGDWLNLGGGASNGVVGTAYDAYDTRLMAEMAAAIGKTEDAARYSAEANKFKDGFNTAFVNRDGSIKDSSQTGYALAFTMGLVPEPRRAMMADQFANEIRRFDNHLATGFIGTPRILPALHLAGRDDLAYKLLLQPTFPSWLYQVKLGATTMWERWDGWTPEKGYQDSGMNSFNHYAFGSVGEYLFGMVGGIRTESPGYRTIRIEPIVKPGLNWATVSYDSIQGRITSRWHRKGKQLILDVEIPCNTVARVVIPTSNAASILESGKPIVETRKFKLLGVEHGATYYEVWSGSYHFVATMD